jgi:hypothetical protein
MTQRYIKETWPDKDRYTAFLGMTEEQISGLVLERGNTFVFVTKEEYDAANPPAVEQD